MIMKIGSGPEKKGVAKYDSVFLGNIASKAYAAELPAILNVGVAKTVVCK